MQYDAITIDTNIFRQNGYYLEGGMLGQLSQFKEGSVQFVLSEIVVQEILKHMTLEAEEAMNDLAKGLSKTIKSGVLPSSVAATIAADIKKAQPPVDAATKRLKDFADKTGLQIIPADKADMKELVKMYFAPEPPFEATGKKKNEFPDAIALLSLEASAKASSNKVLAISDDGGWAGFAKNSTYIDVEKDLAAALQKLQEDAAEAQKIIATLLADVDANKRETLQLQIDDAVSDEVSALDVSAEASSAYYFEEDQIDLSFSRVKFLYPESGYDFQVVQIGKGKIVAKIGVSIDAVAQGQFAFSVWDSIDKEYVRMGAGSAQADVEFEAAILVTFEGELSPVPGDVEIASCELVDAIDSVDFGEIEPDRDEEDE